MNKKILYQQYFIRLFCLSTIPILIRLSDFKQKFTPLLIIVILYTIIITVPFFLSSASSIRKFTIYNMYLDITMVSIGIAIRGGLRSDLYLAYFIILGYSLMISRQNLILRLSSWIVLNYSLSTFLFTPNEDFSAGRLVIRLSLIVSIALLHQNYSNMLLRSESLREKAVNLATFDPLTGLYNRRVIEYVDNLFVEKDLPLCVAMLDLDDFKYINDTYGHSRGDEVLIVLATEMLNMFDDESFCIRYGGEEFLIITQSNGQKTLLHKIEKIQNNLAHHNFEWLEEGYQISLTSGISRREGSEEISEIIVRADKSLYIGKQNGKNRIIFDDNSLVL